MLRDHKTSNNRDSRLREEHIVEHSSDIVQRLKQKLADKKGIPPKQQRLVFSRPSLHHPGKAKEESAVQDLLLDISHSRAVIFQNKRAIGCLVEPQISFSEDLERVEAPAGNKEGSKGVSVLLVTLRYSRWQLAGSDKTSLPLDFSIDLDSSFQDSSIRIQVFCQRGDHTLILPSVYEFSGGLLASAAKVEFQRQEYIRLHQEKRQVSLQGLPKNTEFQVKLGEETGGLQATFDASQQPLQLKALALDFVVGGRLKALDEAPSLQSSPPISAEPGKPTPQVPQPESSKHQIRSKQQNKSMPAKETQVAYTGPRSPRRGSRGKLSQPVTDPVLASRADSLAEALGMNLGSNQSALPQGKGVQPDRTGKSQAQKSLIEEADVGESSLEHGWEAVDPPVMQGGPSGNSRMALKPLGTESLPTPQGVPMRGNDSRSKPTQQKYMPPQKRQQAALQAAKLREVQGTGSWDLPVVPPVVTKGIPAARLTPTASPVGPPAPATFATERPGGPNASTWLSQKSPTTVQPRSPLVFLDTSGSKTAPAPASPFPPISPPAAATKAREEPRPRTPPGLHPTDTSGSLKGSEGSRAGTAIPKLGSREDKSLGSRLSEEASRHSSVGRDTFATAQSSTGASDDHYTGDCLGRKGSGSLLSESSLATAYSISESDPNTPSSAMRQFSDSCPSAPVEGPSGHVQGSSGVVGMVNGTEHQPRLRSHSSREGAAGPPSTASAWRPDRGDEKPSSSSLASLAQLQEPLAEAEQDRMAQNWREIGMVWNQTMVSGSDGSESAPQSTGERSESRSRSDSSDSRIGSQYDTLPNGLPMFGPADPALYDLGMEATSNGLPHDGLDSELRWGGILPTRPLSERNFSTRSHEDSPLPRGFDTTPLPPGVFFTPGAFPLFPPGRRHHLNGFHPTARQESLEWMPRVVSAVPPTEDYPHMAAFPLRASEPDLSWNPGQQAGAARTGDERGRPRPGFLSPPPPPPPRLSQPSADAMELASSLIERQGSFQVPSPVQATAFEKNGPPASDLERFVASVTPVLYPKAPGESAKDLTLNDVWQFFEEASSFGKEVYTRGGRRGPALAYYTPTLSAIRALLPCKETDRKNGEIRVIPIVQHFEVEPPFNREPLHNAVTSLTSPLLSDVHEGDWRDIQLGRLAPSSWFAVTWYPIYRIPDSPLSAKFLTYHSFSPRKVWQTHYGVQDTALEEAGSPGDDESAWCLPLLGLKCAEQRGEPWLEPYNLSPVARREWEERYQQLQQNARSLSVGRSLRVQKPDGSWVQPSAVHNDLDWFHRHP